MTLELAIKVTMVLSSVVLGGWLLRRASAATRHLVQVWGLVAVLALPLLAVALPTWEVPLLAPPAEPGGPDLDRLSPLGLRESTSAAPATAPTTLPVVTEPRSTGSERVAATPTFRQFLSWLAPSFGGFVWLWVAGAAFVVLRLAVGWWRMNRLAIEASPLASRRAWETLEDCARRLDLRRLPRVLTSDRLRVPVLWGFIQPTLMLPAEATTWSLGRLRVVMLHELAHLRRRDGISLLVGRLSVALWWFHPLAWWVERRARHDCERACDDIVLGCGERPSSYAGHLLDIAGTLAKPPGAPALAIVERGELGGRVRSILSPEARRGLGWTGTIVVTAVIAIGVAAVASATLVARAAEKGDRAGRDSIAKHVAQVQRALHDGDSAGRVDRVGERVEDAIMLAHGGGEAGERAFDEAMRLHRQEQWAEAAEAFLEAAGAGYREDTALYNAACGYARMGRAVEAVDLIERSVAAGFDNYELIAEDSDLDPVRRDATFHRMMNEISRQHSVPADRYEETIARYEELLAADSIDGGEWYTVGSALLYLRELDRAVDAFERASDNLESKGNALYNTACAYALAGNDRQALDYLERAVLEGFESEERFENDTDLNAIRETDRFAEIRRLHDDLSIDRFRNSGNSWNSEYSASRWEPAVAAFGVFTQEHPEIGRGWFNLGWSLHYSRRHEEAREAFITQQELGYKPRLAAYNVACTYAMEGRTDEALDWLERAMEVGPVSLHQLIGDEDLESLNDDPRFEALLERAAANEEEAHDRDDEGGMFDEWKRQLKQKQKQKSSQY